MSLEKTSYDQLITQIGNLLQSGRKQAVQAVTLFWFKPIGILDNIL